MGDAGSDAASAAAAAAANYKKLKEDFVSNLSGGSAGEVFLVTAIAPLAILTWSILQRRQSFFRPIAPLGFVVDFLLNVAAILLAITLYSDQPILLGSFLVAQTLFVLALPKRSAGRHALKPKPSHRPNADRPSTGAAFGALPKKPFLTTYRGCMLVITCLAILAVDFRVFPRRFAKVETWGTSLMDMGVGSFVFSGGVVAARPVLKERIDGRTAPLGRRLLASLRHSLPLLVLGVIRMLSVKGLDYAEHVTEYGVHWNFFFTLGLLPPFVAVSQSALRVVPSYAALAVALAGVYQVALEHTNLKAFILTAPRVDLLSRNREGVFSFIGYLAIFLAGQHTGLYVLPRGSVWGTTTTTKNTSWLSRIKLNSLPVWTVIWHTLWQLSIGYPVGLGLTESRRLANLPYVLWVLSFNTLQLSLFALVDTVVFPAFYEAADAAAEAAAYKEATSSVLEAYNRNGLVVFLLANLLTGLVNLTVPTLDVGRAASVGILLGYGAVLTAVAVALDRWNIVIKL